MMYHSLMVSILAIGTYAAPTLPNAGVLTGFAPAAPDAVSQAAAAPAAAANAVAAPAKVAANATAVAAPAAPASGAAAALPVTVSANGAILPDGRIAQNIVATDFNSLPSVFKSAVVKGDTLKFSDLIEFPTVASPSIFDVATNTKAFELTISDDSIFQKDNLTRRADLLPSIRSALNDSATTGVKTVHFSVQSDAAKPLNTSHGYSLVFLESADFSTHQFSVNVGTNVDAAAGSAGADGKNIVVVGNSKATGGAPELFSTPFVDGFHNFGLSLDFDKNTVEVFHSLADAPLASVAAAAPNDLTGNGEFHFAIVKANIGGFQPTGIDEGIIYGGIFIEDTATAPVSLS